MSGWRRRAAGGEAAARPPRVLTKFTNEAMGRRVPRGASSCVLYPLLRVGKAQKGNGLCWAAGGARAGPSLELSRQRLQRPWDHGPMGSDAVHDAFEAFWESGGPWPPLALSVIIGVVTMTMGLMLVYHGTKMSSSPLILCSVTGLLIGLALTVVLPQVRAGFARAAQRHCSLRPHLHPCRHHPHLRRPRLHRHLILPHLHRRLPRSHALHRCTLGLFAARFSTDAARVTPRRRWRG